MLRILFLARLKLLCKTGCVPHYFQYKRGHTLDFPPKSRSQILNYHIISTSVAYCIPRNIFVTCGRWLMWLRVLGGPWLRQQYFQIVRIGLTEVRVGSECQAGTGWFRSSVLVQLFFFFFFKSSGGWVKIKLKLPHFHVSDTRRV